MRFNILMRGTEKEVTKKRDESEKKYMFKRVATQKKDCRDGACILPNIFCPGGWKSSETY